MISRFSYCFAFFLTCALKLHVVSCAMSCANVTNVTEYDIGEMIFSDPRYQVKDITWQRPVRNAMKPVDVSIRLVVSSLNDVIEKDGVLKLNGYLAIKYFDEYKTWNTTWPYSCLQWITVPFDHVWLPDIAVINAESRYDLLYSKKQDRVRVYSNGLVYYLPGGTFTMYCQFDIRLFPLDKSTCVLEIESWRIPLNGQTFTMADPPVSQKYWREHEQWSLVNFSGRVESAIYFTGSSYGRVTFSLTLKRKVEYYLVNVIVPSIIISLAQLSVFSLPVDEVIKIHVCFTCLLAYGVFQLMIIEDMPRASDHIPLLSIYIDLSMGYIAASMIGEAAVFLSLRKSEAKRPEKIPKVYLRVAEILAIPFRIEKPKKGRKRGSDKDELLHLHNGSRGYFSLFHGRYHSVVPFGPASKNSSGSGSSDDEASESEPKSGTNVSSLKNAFTDHDTILEAQGFGKHDVEKLNAAEWQFLARVLDWTTFSLYLLSIVATPTVLYGIVPAAMETTSEE